MIDPSHGSQSFAPHIPAQAYWHEHRQEADKYQLVMESDSGVFRPKGLAFSGSLEATCVMAEILQLLAPINATKVARQEKQRYFGYTALYYTSDNFEFFSFDEL